MFLPCRLAHSRLRSPFVESPHALETDRQIVHAGDYIAAAGELEQASLEVFEQPGAGGFEAGAAGFSQPVLPPMYATGKTQSCFVAVISRCTI